MDGKTSTPPPAPGRTIGKDQLQRKLKFLKDHLKNWNKITFGNVSQQTEDLLRQIKELDEKESLEGLKDHLRSGRILFKDELLES